jgi:hypothetical protein
MPLVTLQVLPGVAHNANASGFIVADDAAAYAEHVVGGYVFTDEQTGASQHEHAPRCQRMAAAPL